MAPDHRRFIGVPDELSRVLIPTGSVWAVLRAIVYEQQRRHRSPGSNEAVPISLGRFQELTTMSIATVKRGLARARGEGLVAVKKGGGRSVTSSYALAEKLAQPRAGIGAGNRFTGELNTGSSGVAHKEVIDSGEPSIGPSPLSEKSEEATPLRLGLDLLALGVAVQIVKPSGAVIECRPDDHGKLSRLLGSNNPELAIAVLISDRPSPGVLCGDEKPRIIARLQRAAPRSPDEWPLMKILSRLEDIGHPPVKKGPRWQSKCPLCGRRDVLELKERQDGKVNVKCYRSCDTEQVLAVIGLTMADLYLKASKVGVA